MASVAAQEESIFEGSDTEFENITFERAKKRKLAVRSPNKSDGARRVKQQVMTVLKSPKKEASLNHEPLTDENRRNPSHIPYYLVNFEAVLRGVMDETDDWELFAEDEIKIVRQFQALDLNSKKLYVRLFQRKHAWILRSQISYDEVLDTDACLGNLITASLLQSGKEIDDLQVVLRLIPSPGLKGLCKELKINPKNGHQKQDYINALIQHSKQKTFRSFFSPKGFGEDLSSLIMSKARNLVGASFKVSQEPRSIFHRVLSLYSLSNFWDDRESEKGQQSSGPPQLTTLLLQNTGRLVFPSYNIIRERKIFRHREDLLHFEQVCSLESSMSEAFADKNWDEAGVIGHEAIGLFNQILNDQDVSDHVKALPKFLRKFTSGSVLAYVVTKCVEVFERAKNYEKAVETLQSLLGQDLYLPDYHGFWHERLAQDLDHLKQMDKCLETILDGLNNPNVQEARLLALCYRANKICNAKSGKFKQRLQDFTYHPRWTMPPDPGAVTISGKLLPKQNVNSKTVFIMEGEDEDVLCSVEEFVREHYKRHEGFTNGVHGEGAVVNTVAAILFWDIIFDLDIPDVFRSPHQSAPLDFNCSDFYNQRKEAIDERLIDLENWTNAEVCNFAQDNWNRVCGVSACPANFELFSDVEHFISLLECFTGSQLAGICKRLMTNHRHTRSGFPDLTIWDPKNQKVAFVEVKGPNDRLSNKQILWIRYLNCLNLSAFVCHVEALNAKHLSSASSTKTCDQKTNHVTSPMKQKKSDKLSRKNRERRNSEDDFVL